MAEGKSAYIKRCENGMRQAINAGKMAARKYSLCFMKVTTADDLFRHKSARNSFFHFRFFNFAMAIN